MELKNINWKHEPNKYTETSTKDRLRIVWEFAISDVTTVFVIQEKIKGKFTSGTSRKPYSCEVGREYQSISRTFECGLNMKGVNEYIDRVKSDGDFEIKDGVLLKYHGKEPNVVIPNNVKSVREYAFYENATMKTITIPASITEIGKKAFYCHCKLDKVYYDGTVENWCNIRFNDRYSNPMNMADSFYMQDNGNGYKLLTDLVIPNSVTKIGDYQFYNFTSISALIIPNSVTIIGKEAFCRCIKLTSITIPDSVSVICSYAFRNCSNLEDVTIGSGLKSFELPPFEYCWKIKNMTLKMKECAFDNTFDRLFNFVDNPVCSIENIHFAGTPSEWNSFKKSHLKMLNPKPNYSLHFVADDAVESKGVGPEVAVVPEDINYLGLQDGQYVPFGGFGRCCCGCRSNINNNK